MLGFPMRNWPYKVKKSRKIVRFIIFSACFFFLRFASSGPQPPPPPLTLKIIKEKICFSMPSAKNRLQILDLHPKNVLKKKYFFWDTIKLDKYLFLFNYYLNMAKCNRTKPIIKAGKIIIVIVSHPVAGF